MTAGHDQDPRRTDRPRPGAELVPTGAEQRQRRASAATEGAPPPLGGQASYNSTASAPAVQRMQTRASAAQRHVVADGGATRRAVTIY